jgi:hypothetical protein
MARKLARPEAKSRGKSKRNRAYADNKARSKIQSEFTIPAALDYQKVLERAREYFYRLDPNIIGVNIGP